MIECQASLETRGLLSPYGMHGVAPFDLWVLASCLPTCLTLMLSHNESELYRGYFRYFDHELLQS